MNHPNVCTIHEVFEIDAAAVDPTATHSTVPVIVLEWVDGETLQARLSRGGRLPVSELLGIAVQVAEGLAEAHSRHMVHRDLKPGNIMVTPAGRTKILDFGLAKPIASRPEAADARTRTALDTREHAFALGTPAYMSPEQAQSLPLDSRSDVFSFGTVLYEMAAGRRPFDGGTATSTIAKVIETEPKPLVEQRNDLPADLVRIVQRCLQKNPADRYNDTRDLLADLKGVQRSLELRSSGAFQPDLRSRKRRPLVWVAAAGVLAAAGYTARALITRAPGPPPSATHRQLTFVGTASFPALSSDGSFIAYVRGEPWGESYRTVSPIQPQKVVVQDLSPNGRTIDIGECRTCGYLRWAPNGSGVLVSDQTQQVLLLARLGGELRRFGPTNYLSWSPRGDRFAGGGLSSRSIVVTDIATGRQTEIRLTWPYTWLRSVDWSTDERWLAALTTGDTDTSIWVVSGDGQAQHKILERPETIASIRWAPRADALYYLQHSGQTRDLWKVPVSPAKGTRSGEPAVVLGGLQAGPNFDISSDGRSLTYTREIRYSNLWTAPTSGTAAPVQLTTGTQEDAFPAISPDGTTIAFVRNDGHTSSLLQLPIAGGTPKLIATLSGITGAAAWSPDGTTLAFCAEEGGVRKVWTMSATGGKATPFDKSRCTTSGSEVPVVWIAEHALLYHRMGNRNYYALDLRTAREEPLLSDESRGWLFDPRASPNGTRLSAFWNVSAGRGLWLLPAPGHEPSLIRANAWPLRWSADGRTIYGFDPTTFDILSIGVDGGATSVLRSLAGQRVGLLPAMTPDGTRVVYSNHAIHSDVWLVKDFDPSIR